MQSVAVYAKAIMAFISMGGLSIALKVFFPMLDANSDAAIVTIVTTVLVWAVPNAKPKSPEPNVVRVDNAPGGARTR